jgi:uncharacterized protein (UPF0147 family)
MKSMLRTVVTMAKKEKINLAPVIELLEQIVNDRTVPKNIRAAAEEAHAAINGTTAVELKISTAISTLDDIINDTNMPMYTRTQIWNIVSMLEGMRRDL